VDRIVTVLGDIDPGDLGFCQSHEHLSIAPGYSAELNPDLRIDNGAKTLEELLAYRGAGGMALVDAQPPGCGRDPDMLAFLSRKSGVHIIASTGFHRLVFYPESHWIHALNEDTLTRLFLDELDRGMYGLCDDRPPKRSTASRAGQIKTALDAGTFTAEHEKLFRAAAAAARSTGSALMVHIEKGSAPLGLADFLFKLGVEPERLVFCHPDRAVPQIEIHRELCGRGINLEYDTIGRPKYHDDDHEADIICVMIEAGFEDRILMSLDVTRARLASYGGIPGLTHILHNFIPRLRRRGISETAIGRFFFRNPARIFSRPIQN
jgi:phosphotriesterase-related protein